MKENDFLVAGLNNPNYDNNMFLAIGMDSSNTQMLSKDEYLKSNYIKNNDAFKDKEGNFSEETFNNYYDQKLKEWTIFSQLGESGLEFDLFDYRRFTTPNARVRNPKLSLSQVANPDEITIGTGKINKLYESPLSERELAEKNKIFDSATGKFLDYSPDDHALFSNPLQWFKDIFNDSLVLATWDEDGTHIDPITGNMVEHKKGQKKLNEDGKYFYETLNGRSLYGKTVLSGWDTLTAENSKLNKYDFFDSDDKDKSIGAILLKDALAIAPLFLPAPVGLLYGSLLIGREIGKSLPMIDGLFASITNKDTPFTKIANTIAGKMTAATQDRSDTGNEAFSFEGLADTMVDVALQWQQQKLVAQAIQKISGAKNLLNNSEITAKKLFDENSFKFRTEAEKRIAQLKAAGKMEEAAIAEKSLIAEIGEANIAKDAWKTTNMGKYYLTEQQVKLYPKVDKLNKLAQRASLAYMVGVSNTDVYETCIAKGLSKREALAVTFGSALGMWAVDTSGLGEVFFDRLLTEEGKMAMRATLKKSSDKWISALERNISLDAANKTSKFNLINWIKKGSDNMGKTYSQFIDDIKHHSGGFFTKAVGEGLEEVGEELASDISKQLYEWAYSIKPINNLFGGLTEADLEAFDNGDISSILERYAQNFLGGFLGGGIFYGVEQTQGKTWKRNTDQDQLIYILRNNKKADVLQTLEEYRKKGKLGSTKLGYKAVKDSNGNSHFITADSDNISQNDFIYNQLKFEIEGLDKIINSHNLKLSDGQLYDQLTLADARFQALKDKLMDADYQDAYVSRYQNLVQDVIEIESQINSIKNEKIEDSDKIKQADRDKRLQKVEQILKDKLKEIDDFKSGENAIDYMGMILFQLNEDVNKDWITPNFHSWLKLNKNLTQKEFLKLPDESKNALIDDWNKYKNEVKQYDIENAWKNFKYFSEQISPELEGIQDRIKEYKEKLKALSELSDPKTNPLQNIKQYTNNDFTLDNENEEFRISIDDNILGESEEEYLNRYQLENESNEDYEKRKNLRLEKIKERKRILKNRSEQIKALTKVKEIIENAGGMLDSQTKRRLLLNFKQSQKDIAQAIISKSDINDISTRFSKEVKAILSNIKSDDDLVQARSNLQSIIKSDKVLDFKRDLQDRIDYIKTFTNLKHISPEQINITTVRNDFQTKLLHLQLVRQAIPDKYVKNGSFDKETFKADYKLALQELFPGKSDEWYTDKVNNIWDLQDTVEEIVEELDEETEENDEEYNEAYDLQIYEILNDKLGFNFTTSPESNNIIYSNFYEECNDSVELSDINLNTSSSERDRFLISYGNVPKELLGIFNIKNSDGEINWNDVENNILKMNGLSVLDFTDYEVDEYKNVKIDINQDKFDTQLNKQLSGRYINTLGNTLNEYFDKSSESESVNYLSKIERDLNSDDLYQAISVVSKAQSIENPINGLVKKLCLVLNKDPRDIETILNFLTEQMEQDNKQNFELSPEQVELLKEASMLLKLTQSFIKSAYNSAEFYNPFPANQFINEIIDEHKLKLEHLPVIDDDVAGTYWQRIQDLLYEIGIPTESGYTEGSWLYWNSLNEVNKTKMHQRADIKLDAAFVEFFMYNKTILSGTTKNGKRFNLLKGIDNLNSDDPFINKVNMELLISENFKELQNDGYQFEEILDSCPALIQFINNHQNDLMDQNTANLDEHLTHGKLTPMDIINYLACVITLNPSNYYQYLNEYKFNDKIAPLAIQQYDLRLAVAEAENPKLFHEATHWLHSKVRYPFGSTYECGGIFIPGNGGAGKSEVIIPQYIDYLINIKKINKNDIVVSAPEKTQYDKLKQLTGCKEYSLENLMKNLLDVESIDNIETHTYEGVNGSEVSVATNNIKFKNTNIKAIIIDEATHVSTKIFSILTEFQRQTGCALLFVGDNFQNGYKNVNGTNENLNQEVTFISRAPRINITLRDSNIQKQTNNNELVLLSNELNLIPTDDTRNSKIELALNHFRKLKMLGYNRDKIGGDLLIDSVSDSLTSKLKSLAKKDASIGFIGTENKNYNKLKSALGNLLDSPKTESEIQGQEYDYVIIDVDWDENIYANEDSLDIKHAKLLKFMQRLYTLSTRSKIGSIFIDNNLGKHIQFQLTDNWNSMTNFNANAIKDFKNHFINKLSNISEIIKNKVIIPDDKNESEELSKEENKSEENPDVKEGFESKKIILSGNAYIQYNVDGLNNDDFETYTELKKESRSDENANNVSSSMQDSPIHLGLCYTSASLLGGKIDGQNWIFDLNEPIRDVGIFVTENNTTISDGEIKNDLVRKLLLLKTAILYGVDINDSSKMKPLVDFGITQDTIKKALQNVKIVVSEKSDKDAHVGYTRMWNNQMDINGLVYRLVSEFEVNGKKVQLTLGLLANPQSYLDRIKDGSAAENIQRKIDSLKRHFEELTEDDQKKIVEDKINEFENELNTLEDRGNKYQAIINEMADRHHRKNNPQSEFNVTNLNFNKNTLLLKYETDEEGNRVRINKMRLSPLENDQDVDPRNSDNKSTQTSFLIRNQEGYTVCSDIYVMISNKSGSEEIRNTISGNAVMFVSKNLSLNKEELAELWLKERNNSLRNKQVRMIVLDNAGISFSDMCTTTYYDKFNIKTNNERQDIPIEREFLAIRQLIALHNFKVRFDRFKNKFKSRFENIDSNFINDVLFKLHETYIEYRNNNKDNYSESGFREYVKNNNTLSEDEKNLANEIWAFNEFSGDDFKLGTDSGKHHFQIRSTNPEDVKKNGKLVGKPEKYSLYLDLIAMDQISIVLDNTFELLKPLNIKLVKFNTTKDFEKEPVEFNIGTDLEDFNTVIENTKKLGIRISSKDDIALKIGDDFDNKILKEIPKILTKVGSRALAFRQTEIINGERILPATISKLDGSQVEARKWDQKRVGSIRVKIKNKIDNTSDPDVEIIKLNADGKLLEFIENNSDYIPEIFNLIFHGTVNTKGLLDKMLYGRKSDKTNQIQNFEPQMSSALFKNGFFIDPMISLSDFKTNNDVRLNEDGSIRFVKCKTNTSLFVTDVNVGNSTISFDFDLDNTQSAVVTEKESGKLLDISRRQQSNTKGIENIQTAINNGDKYVIVTEINNNKKNFFESSNGEQILGFINEKGAGDKDTPYEKLSIKYDDNNDKIIIYSEETQNRYELTVNQEKSEFDVRLISTGLNNSSDDIIESFINNLEEIIGNDLSDVIEKLRNNKPKLVENFEQIRDKIRKNDSIDDILSLLFKGTSIDEDIINDITSYDNNDIDNAVSILAPGC